MVAYWISPKGEIIDVPNKHINVILENPEKFGFDRDFIEFIHDTYGEKLGTEGKSREQLMKAAFKSGWIRIRQYKTFYTVNVKRLAGRSKSYLTQWAQKILKGLFGYKEQDKFIPVKIDQENKPIKSVELQDIATSDKFVSESKYTLTETTINDMMVVESIVEETKKGLRRMLFNEYLNETSLNRVRSHMSEHDSGTITAFRDEYSKGENKARNKVLSAKLMKQFSVTKAKGSYIENYNTKDAKEVGENVFIVVDINDNGKLKKVLMDLGEEFEQDSILFIPKGGEQGFLIGTMHVEYPGYHNKIPLKNPIFGKNDQISTKVNGRPFVLKESMTEISTPSSRSGKWAMDALSKKDWKEFYDTNKDTLEK